ncbi:Uncharacterized protein Rs2_35434 [Raphanus sativus]|nr:Uncharacterized protein Rs2_35434 [Raphanus sativus]
MANSYNFLADLRAGICLNTAEVRLLRLWEAENINRGEQLMSMKILLIDETCKLYLNGPSATRVFFDCETAVGKDAFERMRLRDCQVVGQTRKGLHQRWSTLKRLNPSQSLILTSLY